MRTLLLLSLCAFACDSTREKARTEIAEVKDKATVAQAKAFDAAATGLRIKGELDKVYKTTSDYDLDISADGVDDDGMKAHEARIAAMPNVKVGDLTVGYEESQERSLKGQTFARHFRATWVHGGKKVGVGYYSKEEIDAVAFAALLEKLVPAVQMVVGSSG